MSDSTHDLAASTPNPDQGKPDEPLIRGEGWLIRLRWPAILGISICVAGSSLAGVVERPGMLAAACLAMIAANVCFSFFHARGEPGDSTPRISLQVLADMAVLTLLLHWSGGMQNPFAMFFAYHVAIAASLLPVRLALLLGLLGASMFGGTVLAEFLGWLPHHPLMTTVGPAGAESLCHAWRDPILVTGYLTAFVLMLFGVIYFVATVAGQREHAWQVARMRERVALARERMARVGQISAGVAHSIRNPLHGVHMCEEFLRGRLYAGDAEVAEILDLLREGVTRIDSVTSRLLVLTREDHLAPRPSDVSRVVGDAMAFVQRRFERDGVPLCLELHELPEIDVDRDRLSEALLSLVDNARDACKQGGSVTVRTHLAEDAIVIQIEDTGIGIDPTHVSQVFDPFFTTKPAGEGTGLGMGIGRKIIKQHGGTISVESALGHGTTVSIRLPLTGPPHTAQDENDEP